VGGFTAFAAGRRRQIAVLGKASFFIGHAGAALAGDFTLAVFVHRGESPPGGLSGLNLVHDLLLIYGPSEGVVAAA
jgi:hypothetical protein